MDAPYNVVMCPDFGQFTEIAEHYDALMAGVPYGLWVDYVQEILRRLNWRPRTVLDVACGTGSVAEILAAKGYEVVGVDISPAMVEVARRKSAASGSGTQYQVQDAAELSLPAKFDLAISLYDSLNYVLDEHLLAAAIERVAEHVVSGGLFIFDVNTEYALAHGFFNQSNVGTGVYPRYVWISRYDRESRMCTINMAFEVQERAGTKRQFTEVHRQRAYTLEELDAMLSQAGFETVARYHAYKFKQPGRRSDRVFFVARKL